MPYSQLRLGINKGSRSWANSQGQTSKDVANLRWSNSLFLV